MIDHPAYDVRVYKPNAVDNQKPHTRDEVYVIASGTGDFVLEGETQSFNTGDLIFAPAGAEQRFINFSDDFSAWVIFFGAASSYPHTNIGPSLRPPHSAGTGFILAIC